MALTTVTADALTLTTESALALTFTGLTEDALTLTAYGTPDSLSLTGLGTYEWDWSSMHTSDWSENNTVAGDCDSVGGRLKVTMPTPATAEIGRVYTPTTYSIAGRSVQTTMYSLSEISAFGDHIFAVGTVSGISVSFPYLDFRYVSGTLSGRVRESALTTTVGSVVISVPFSVRIVNDGATYTFDYATSADGPWTTLGSSSASTLSPNAVRLEMRTSKGSGGPNLVTGEWDDTRIGDVGLTLSSVTADTI